MRGDQHELPPLGDAVERLEEQSLSGRPRLTRQEVADAAGVHLVVAEQLWRLLGFARPAEWQTSWMARVALEDGSDPAEQLTRLSDDILPRIDKLES